MTFWTKSVTPNLPWSKISKPGVLPLGSPRLAFTRAWTAKEAVLKKHRFGLRRLSECRIVAAWHDGAELLFDGRTHRVHQLVLEDHVAAVAFDTNDDEAPDWIGAEARVP